LHEIIVENSMKNPFVYRKIKFEMEKLPQDVVISILLFLDRYSIGQVCRLNTKFAKICRIEHMWKQLTLNATPEEDRKHVEKETEQLKISWKLMYKDLSTTHYRTFKFNQERIIHVGSGSPFNCPPYHQWWKDHLTSNARRFKPISVWKTDIHTYSELPRIQN
jgi:hypothetical protein